MESSLVEKINEGVIRERAHAITRNVSMNKMLIDKWGGLRHIMNDLAGKDLIIVGAGPSLDSEIAELRKIASRSSVVIISADMAYQPLIKCGITPRYAISCETTPRDFFAASDTSKCTLLAFSGVCPRIVREWKGVIRFYNWMVHGEPYDSIWQHAGVDLGFAATGSTVTTQAVSIALGCSVRSLLMVGNDLGFYDRIYACGTVRRNEFERLISRQKPLDSIEYSACRKARHYLIPREKIFSTNHQFLAAKQWLESLFAKGNQVVFDSSVPGVAGKNIEKINVKGYAGRIVGNGGRR